MEFMAKCRVWFIGYFISICGKLLFCDEFLVQLMVEASMTNDFSKYHDYLWSLIDAFFDTNYGNDDLVDCARILLYPINNNENLNREYMKIIDSVKPDDDVDEIMRELIKEIDEREIIEGNVNSKLLLHAANKFLEFYPQIAPKTANVCGRRYNIKQ